MSELSRISISGSRIPYQPAFQEYVDYSLALGRFDAVLVFGAEMLQYVRSCQLPVFADLIDEPVLATLREVPGNRGVTERLRSLKHAVSVCFYERRLCRAVHTFMVVSQEYAKSLRRVVPSARVVVSRNGVDRSFFHPMGSPAQPDEIVFSGNMAFPPNIAACLFFAEQVFPRILESCPSARWTIAGSSPDVAVLRLAEMAGVQVTGYVDDLRPILDRAAVVVSPMISGGGIKNKVLEAWAMKKAVVSTPLGCAGVECQDGVNVIIATSAADFARKTARLLHDRCMALELGEQGFRTVAEKYDWDNVAAQLGNVIQTAVV